MSRHPPTRSRRSPTRRAPEGADVGRAEQLIVAVLYLTILEGAVRKWVVGDSTSLLSYAAFLSKDAALLGIALRCRPGPVTPAIRSLRTLTWLGVGLVLIGASLSALSGLQPVGAFLSLRSMVMLPVLLPVVSARLHEVDLPRVATRLAWLSLPVAGLGVAQFYLPPGHTLNRYVDGDAAIVAMGHVRATGTFSFISGMGHLCVVAVWGGVMLGVLRPGSPGFRPGLIAVGSGLTCALTCLSRGPALMAVFLLLTAILIARSSLTLLLTLFLLAGLARWLDTPPPDGADETSVVTALVERHRASESDSVGERLASMVSQPLDALTQFPVGGGFGAGQVGGYAVQGEGRRLVRYETEIARIVLETGGLGLAGSLLLRFGALYVLLIHAIRRSRAPAFRERALISGMTAGIFLVGNVAFDHVASAFASTILALAFAQLARRDAATTVGSTS